MVRVVVKVRVGHFDTGEKESPFGFVAQSGSFAAWIEEVAQ